ncbi:MAG: glyoxalase/bleomycin resistance/extradiol dioxygenase family protein [Paraglaciecola sp.]|nr:glyoxalase/bleomycin resistance/extradiol dioxygenase family protein [Paraglaciecola sp.]NCT48725.1 glyoxalase/bleomycin resistance/extradiol dioxygenase family protein [Paraglaciecola sp.]
MRVTIQAVQPVLMSQDVCRSLIYYAQIGFVQVFVDNPNKPQYAGVQRDGIALHFQWQDATHWKTGDDRPTYRFVVSDVDALHAEFIAAGRGDNMSKVIDTAWGTREFHVRDPHGNGLQFYRA